MKTEALQFQALTRGLKEVLKSAKDIEANAPAVLELLAKCFECHWATYWKVDSDQQVLRAIETWSESRVSLKPLLRDTESRALTLSEGAAGRVWKSGQPLCTSDLVRDMRLPRSLYAKSAGLSGGIWFPIRAKQTTYGVIELLGKHCWPIHQQFLDRLMVLGELIGEMLQSSGNLSRICMASGPMK